MQSVFFGGGTPSTFHPSSIGQILEKADCVFNLASDCEITLEANPGTVDRANFFGYRASGVNRISVGIQSFQPQLLKFLGRVHSAEEAMKALGIVKEAPFENFSLDLIYANPAQTMSDLQSDLEIALSFEPPHLSAYNLTIEEETPFHHEYRRGRLQVLDEEDEIGMAELIEAKLRSAGLQRYEISNYARAGFESRHNVNYWQDGDYLGIGAGAHSYKRMHGDGIFGIRWSNEKIPSRYMAKVAEDGHAVYKNEDGDLKTAAAEFMLSGLRILQGVSSKQFQARFGQEPAEFYPEINAWIEEGLMEECGARLRLTRRGLMVANSIFVHFV